MGAGDLPGNHRQAPVGFTPISKLPIFSDASNLVPAPRSGTKLIREWQGMVHEVLALEDGQFAYGGKTYRSLTMIARQITGTNQSGPRFFGLKPSASSSVAGSAAIG